MSQISRKFPLPVPSFLLFLTRSHPTRPLSPFQSYSLYSECYRRTGRLFNSLSSRCPLCSFSANSVLDFSSALFPPFSFFPSLLFSFFPSFSVFSVTLWLTLSFFLRECRQHITHRRIILKRLAEMRIPFHIPRPKHKAPAQSDYDRQTR